MEGIKPYTYPRAVGPRDVCGSTHSTPHVRNLDYEMATTKNKNIKHIRLVNLYWYLIRRETSPEFQCLRGVPSVASYLVLSFFSIAVNVVHHHFILNSN